MRRVLLGAAALASVGNGPAAPDNRRIIKDFAHLKDGKIVEHWDVIQPIPEKSANAHPMF
ncbi:MAG: hypothetical protein ACO1OX_14940 [Novosphingobium sp.]